MSSTGNAGTPETQWYGACTRCCRWNQTSVSGGENVKIMQQYEDPRKRPLLTAAQLQIMRRVQERPKKGNPREEFEKLFRLPTECPQT